MTDSQSRKWFVTINNPADKGFAHEKIKTQLSALKSIVYYCMSDEIGTEEHTPHTHIFIYSKSPIRFSSLKNALPPADLEHAKGTAVQCREYIQKSGVWADSDKRETSISGTFEEVGDIPQERQGARNDLAELYELIKDGMTNAEIIERNPDYLLRLTDIERTRQTIRAEEYRDVFRMLEVKYIWGKTGVGKTRFVMDKYGYSAVYRVHDYLHPFDSYQGEDVLTMDEYVGQIKMQDVLNLLDGYPITLPCRYANKQACFTKVFIISNLDLREQYKNTQTEQPEVWKAFLRRVNSVIKFAQDGTFREYPTHDYLYGFIEIDEAETPFDGQ